MQPTRRFQGDGVSKRPRRAAIACTACRQSKIKCSGDEPCVHCRRRSLNCQFAEGNSQVMVSERYLRQLQKQAYNWQRTNGVNRPQDDELSSHGDITKHHTNDIRTSEDLLDLGIVEDQHTGATPAKTSCNIWTSPFTLPTTVFPNTRLSQRNWIWLAPASPWSLTARLITMMTEKLIPDATHDCPRWYLDGDIYPFAWDLISGSEPVETGDLPSQDYVKYLLQIVRFRLSRAYRFLEDDSLLRYIHRFYNDRSKTLSTEPRFAFVRFLMILALGHAFISRPRSCQDPPGSRYFVRAIAAMPKYTSTGKNSLLAIESLALVGLYLYSIDHREAAHVHIGHAIRIAQMEGMHTQLPEEILGAATVTQCRNLWWSLYIIDHHFSPSLGLPIALQDSDITTPIDPPSPNSQDVAFSLQIRITRMLALILRAIYKTEKTQLDKFLDITRSILETMARYAEEIENMIDVSLHGSQDNLPEESRRTILLYHQCVIVATRPLLLSLFKERLDKLGQGEENWQKFMGLPKSLISIGVKSAEKTLHIIGDKNSFIETFLPFDIDMTYAAGIHLTMAKSLFPSTFNDQSYSQDTHAIFDELILCGNRVADARKRELSHLEELFKAFVNQVESEGLRCLSLSETTAPRIVATTGADCSSNPTEVLSQNSEPASGSLFQAGQPTLADPCADNADFLKGIGISSHEFLSIVERIDHTGVSHGDLDFGPDWLIGEDIRALYG